MPATGYYAQQQHTPTYDMRCAPTLQKVVTSQPQFKLCYHHKRIAFTSRGNLQVEGHIDKLTNDSTEARKGWCKIMQY